jgi:hypothetical protein
MEGILYLLIRRNIKMTVVITEEYHSYKTTNKILSNILLSRLTPYVDKISQDHQCGGLWLNQLLIRYSAFITYWRNKIGKVFSMECIDIPKVFFMPHHVGHCCTDVIQGHCCSLGQSCTNVFWGHCCMNLIGTYFAPKVTLASMWS